MDVSHGYMVSCANGMAKTKWGDAEGTHVATYLALAFTLIQKHFQTQPN